MQPKLVRPQDGRSVSLYDTKFDYKLVSADTGGRLAFVEVTVPPRTLVKPHQHSREDEVSLILTGTLGARVGATTIEEIAAGSYLFKPRDVPHALWNLADEPAHLLEVLSPAGLESYFEEVAPILREHGPTWTARYRALAEAYGLTILDDWSDELQERYAIKL
jgi:quercetin dioxygenase-like cupin family protein